MTKLFAVFLLIGVLCHGTNAAVIDLDDDSFEHDTQAATGGTTGDWFVKFYAPWCGHCKTLAPIWDELAESVQGGHVNIAKVDVTKNPKTMARFDIKGFPTLLFIRQGMVYEYRGKRSASDLQAFVEGGYESVTGFPVPKEPSAFDLIVREFKHAKDDALKIAAKNSPAALVLFCAGGGVGTVLGLCLALLCLGFRRGAKKAPTPSAPSKKAKKAE